MSKERTDKAVPRQSEGVRAFKRGLDVLREVNRSGALTRTVVFSGHLRSELDSPGDGRRRLGVCVQERR